jgi:hypothetical protein
MSIEEIAQKDHRGISMEIVALRDIKQNEEVFIDYGPQWDAAWKSHVANWKPPHRADESLVSATHANANKKEALRKVLTHNIRHDYNSPDVFTGCVFWLDEADQEKKWQNYTEWHQMDDEHIMATYGENGAKFSGDFAFHHDGLHWPCSVIREEPLGQTYTVRVWYFNLYEPQAWEINHLPRVLANFPRESIEFFHKPYTSDPFLKEVFRNPIGIPDEIMPPQWKNLN